MTPVLPLPVRHILQAATPVLRINGLLTQHWRRNVPANDSRFGPWRSARYEVVDAAAWARRSPCLYLVTGQDGALRYVGISRTRLQDRWRLSPALDAQSGAPLRERQLFHSQCWKRLEDEFAVDPSASFNVHCLSADELIAALHTIADPIQALVAMADDGETVVMAVERWICNRASDSLARWNVAMTGRA